MEIIRFGSLNLLGAAVIQATLVIATKREGKLPITVKCKLNINFKYQL